MKTNVLLFTIMSSIIFLCIQCKKENNDSIKEGVKRGEIKLSNAELNIIPYMVNDSIVFKDSLGNSHTFKVKSRNLTFHRTLKDGGTDITTDYYDIENLSVWLKDNNDYYIRFELEAPLPNYCSNQWINKNYFVIYVEPPYNATPPNSRNTFLNYIDTTDFYYTLYGVSIPYHSSMTIINKTFSSVYELISYDANGLDDYIQKIYYKVSKGIVGYQMKSGVKWYLEN